MQTNAKPTLELMRGSIDIVFIEKKMLALHEEIKAHDEETQVPQY